MGKPAAVIGSMYVCMYVCMYVRKLPQKSRMLEGLL